MEEFLFIGLMLAMFFTGMSVVDSAVSKSVINLDVVTEMTAKCDNNGGAESITHGYDVTCKNGAKFPFKE